MKQITMDYDTYISELLEAKKEGFELVDGLSEKIKELIRTARSFSQQEYYEAQFALNDVLNKLQNIERLKSEGQGE